ncbi:Protein of unknown function [Lutibacter agarilyticus]|uniref:DUF3078 domain-containing protein n=1 Tax=Lutibacter agarilyticus TaxID=1109740 RepID=A0A238VUZ0_9FLAO|nr:DUF3078 domain-containing protein [Lutibacter agarilyticus]SNR37977.1 Protein of unknown function [Lutibacter agarilyticus]
MKKVILSMVAVISFSLSFAQEKTKDTTYWNKEGKISFLFNQSAFSNWVAGGENTIAGNLGVDYTFDYVKDKITWNNRIVASYGLTNSKNNEFTKKTDDRLQLNSVIGLKAKNYWSYSFFLNFNTQFAKGYEYGKDANGKEIRTEYTNFMSPGYLAFGPGLLWEKNKNLKFNISPVAVKLVFVDKAFTLPNDKYFGVEEGKGLRTELGLRASGYAKFNIMENISMENILVLYTNYLEDPQNVDLDYTMNLTLDVNKYISANLIFQAVYDDNAFEGFQIREVFGIGVNYNW